jgi:hypothetical protein
MTSCAGDFGECLRASVRPGFLCRGDNQVIRSLFLTMGADGKLAVATTMGHAVLEVLSVPDDYTVAAALEIAESVVKSGVIKSRARAGTRGGPIRITWEALVEKGIAADVLEHEDD